MERGQDGSDTQEKRNIKDIKNHRANQSAFPHVQTVHTSIPKSMEKVLDETQPREEAGLRKVCSTVDHLQTINQLIEICYVFKRPLALDTLTRSITRSI